MRVLASISGADWGDSGTQWFPEPGVAASFAEHAHLADLSSLYGESFEPGVCDCQFTALLALALYSVRHNATHGVVGSITYPGPWAGPRCAAPPSTNKKCCSNSGCCSGCDGCSYGYCGGVGCCDGCATRCDTSC